MKKTFIYLTAVLCTTILFSCNKNAQSKLYVLDSIKLGTSMEEFNTKMSQKMDLSRKPGRTFSKLFFVTQKFLHQEEALDYLSANFYTTTFNTNDNTDYTDYGLIVPMHSSTKDNLVGIVVAFGQTSASANLEDLGPVVNKIGEPVPYFVQSNRANYINNVKSLLISKYGEPSKITKGGSLPMYAFDKNILKGYLTDKTNKGNLLEWENDIVKIKLFEGIENYNYTYYPTEQLYFHAMDEDRNKTKKLDEGHETTRGFAYLVYELTDEYIAKKKLDEPNL